MTDLILPGLNGSGPDHWQTWWLTSGRDARVVVQGDWANPRLNDWRGRLATEIENAPGAILVAHSLSCALVAQTAAWRGDLPIGAALLVAPADVDDVTWTTPSIASFGPISLQPLRFPSIVVASRNDPYVSFARARLFAQRWGSDLVDVGDKGHISAVDGFGPWPLGMALARGLEDRLKSLRKIA